MATESSDNEDLEALFDSIAYAHSNEAPANSQSISAPVENTAGSTDEQSEFSSPNAPQYCSCGKELHSQIGHLTRQLHDTLLGLGYAESLRGVVNTMPDARDRLNYISALTEQSAVNTLNAVEQAKHLQEKLGGKATLLSAQWSQLLNNQLDVDSFKRLAHETHAYLLDVPSSIKSTNSLLTEVVTAQEFHDLTGQVIKKLVGTVQVLENHLLTLLIESIPEENRKDMDETLFNGTLIAADANSEVVTSQAQVDELLENLGF